jgi:hypothetical protein
MAKNAPLPFGSVAVLHAIADGNPDGRFGASSVSRTPGARPAPGDRPRAPAGQATAGRRGIMTSQPLTRLRAQPRPPAGEGA